MSEYVAGKLRCPKCNCALMSQVLYVKTGQVGPKTKAEECPNGCGPMWRVTKDQHIEELNKALEDVYIELDWLKEFTRSVQQILNSNGIIKPEDWNCSVDACGVENLVDRVSEPEQNLIPIGTLDHPCRDTCSGWRQGYDKGKGESFEIIRNLVDKIKHLDGPATPWRIEIAEAIRHLEKTNA